MLKLASLKSFAKFALVFASSLLFSQFAMANTTGGVLCRAIGLFTGNLGKALALFALIALGVSFFMGKISWGTVLAVAFGIACIFGGSVIVDKLAGGTGINCVADTSTAL